MSDSVGVPTTKEVALAALRAAAFEEIPEEQGEEAPAVVALPRKMIHAFSHGAGLALGADWTLAQAVAYVESADDLAWVDHPLGHDLEARADGERLIYFDVRRPT